MGKAYIPHNAEAVSRNFQFAFFIINNDLAVRVRLGV